MTLPDITGALAAFLTTAAFIPQVAHTLRTRDTRAISLPMYVLFTTGVGCWFAYGVMTVTWPIMVGNGITVLCAMMILVMKIRHG